ncbi:MAG: class I SAM-dependent methyltransferase [Cytophagaceae bacterium]
MEKQETTWFSEWFDSPYYHLLYANRDEAEAQTFIKSLMNYLPLTQQATVLDMPCGKGRHANYLASLGYHVVGADLSPNSIEQARQEAQDTAVFTVHDIREAAWEEDFDVVLNLFTSLGYFDSTEDDQAAFQTLSQAVKKEGYLVVDFFNAHKVISQLVAENTVDRGDVQFQLTRRYDGKFIHKDIKFTDKGRAYQFSERVRAFYKEDFMAFSKFVGLQLIETFGSYRLESFDKENSDRLILIFKK